MPCCGKNVRQAGGTPLRRPPEHTPQAVHRAPRNYRFTLYFEYVGRTGLTVVGPATGRRYRFDAPGARVAVDPRDRPALAKIPNLREVG